MKKIKPEKLNTMINKMKSAMLAFGLLCAANLSAKDLENTETKGNTVPMNTCDAVQLQKQVAMVADAVSVLDLEEIEEEVVLGFDTYFYLPTNFNAYEGMAINLEEIRVIEIEEQIDLGFDTAKYLPKDFNPYSCGH